MTDIRNLLSRIAADEAAFQETQFLAPCVRGGQVRAKVAGFVQTFAPRPADFEGWGVFQPAGDRAARVVEEAGLPLVSEYLRLFDPLRLHLVRQLRGQTWLAYPSNESDMRQRWGAARPVPVHLVTEGDPFQPIVARAGGEAWWFEETDRRADPVLADGLREALRTLTDPDAVRLKGLTPEMRTAYDLVAQQDEAFVRQRRERAERQWREDQRRHGGAAARPQPDRRGGEPAGGQDEQRLRGALRTGGGELHAFADRGDYWLVEWRTRDGEQHTSAISKGDLTVVSSGICLSGRDHDFDLQSLVGVIEGREW
uniref:Uncharacterized protein n=1 Tax=uncultured Armatimonadetes bacterium TaxID=157466 RepID=A0A6J4K3U4_9BACT|nr:FIG00870579: hypothetical protein [uncultured Armatimonadetes bacterium]